ncbi:RNA polymerase sigma-70 factor, ECF subfamily [Nonomuraea maritima]|uniref:RNA polymerase sigma-70 factor, ECF subfamily n=1 Tax=Nonomuraea maritima TaxID=683260 RepID=A0A1G9A6C1_9ACTN|nr:sigma-70 family RNA polymerase sigma factor [Nonomuraea maritima]SDK22886.1 RNA polymerase sigma-70 factor, ECF subfamily [Nonomuraea maritima]
MPSQELAADHAHGFEPHRAELTGYCYRMLGSGFEAEDAVQETFVKALRTYDPARGQLRPWLFRLATNVCLDMLRGPQRRARAMDLAPAAVPGAELGVPLPESRWVQPVPDARVLDPADLVVTRETVRLAFVAALQLLPPRQRAVLVLRDVLRWSAAETAGLLGTSVAAVNSALQRARAALPATRETDTEVDEALLDRYVSAFERYDVAALVSLLRADAISSMPPFTWWLRGRESIHAVLSASGAPCAGSRLVRTRANGCPAFGQYLNGEAFALVVMEVEGGLIAEQTTYLDPGLFPFFGLPMSSEGLPRTDG